MRRIHRWLRSLRSLTTG